MDWLNAALNVGSLAVQWNQMKKLNALTTQGAESAMIQAVLHELRDQIFKYKQAAEEIVAAETQNPKRAAGAMRLLDLQLKESGITSDLFFDLNDKEYVAATTKLIRDNEDRMLAGLPEDDQFEVIAIAIAVTRLPDYDYYLANFDDGYRYRAALPESQKYDIGQGSFLKIMTGQWGLVIAMFIGPFFFGALTNSEIGFGLGFILGIVGWFVFRQSYAAPYKRSVEAKKTVKNLQGKIDWERFNALDAEFNGNREQVVNLRQRTRMLVETFFGNGGPAALPMAAMPSPVSTTRTASASPPVSSSSSTSTVQRKGTLIQPAAAPATTTACPACSTQNPSSAKFCMKCGQPLSQ